MAIHKEMSWVDYTEDFGGEVRTGQLWSLAPRHKWDSAAYWVVPFAPRHAGEIAYIARSRGRNYATKPPVKDREAA